MENAKRSDSKHNSKNVMTLTFHGVLNHGAVLQAYALQKFISDLGYKTSLVKYQPWYFFWQVYRPAKGLSKTILKYKRIYLFKKFSHKNLVVDNRSIRTPSDLSKIDNCHAVVCGSDQIWNKDITGGRYDLTFLLSHLKKGIKRISYAASAGGNRLSAEKALLNKYITEFDALGVRENHLLEDIEKEFLHKNAELVLDPTLLINDYSKITCEDRVPKNKEYIVSYEVSSDETREEFNRFIAEVKKITGLPVYHIGDKPIKSADHCLLDISPGDWVSLIKNSSLVCTNSFHGTAFSLNFKKPLIVVSHIEKKRNARVLSLLQSVKLETLFYNDPSELSKRKITSTYETKELLRKISTSQQFLKKAID